MSDEEAGRAVLRQRIATYQPTLQEVQIIRSSNTAYLSLYSFGILTGVSAGFLINKRRGVAWNSTHGVMMIFGTGLVGEFVGRKLAQQRAARVLALQLPVDSKLRQLLEQGRGLNIPRASLESTGDPVPDDTQGYGMISPQSQFTPQMRTLPSPREDISGQASPLERQSGSAWDRIRKQSDRATSIRRTDAAPGPTHDDGTYDDADSSWS
ncbi:hypothetical protein SeLEV6574_g08543, partial [Synchytrium endobioticum]